MVWSLDFEIWVSTYQPTYYKLLLIYTYIVDAFTRLQFDMPMTPKHETTIVDYTKRWSLRESNLRHVTEQLVIQSYTAPNVPLNQVQLYHLFESIKYYFGLIWIKLTCALVVGRGLASHRVTEPAISMLFVSSDLGTSSEFSASSGWKEESIENVIKRVR